ncbi:MAG: PilN domain-containing protein [Acidobacteriaceae bacterium]
MKININLASKPYVDVRSILRRLRIVMLVLVLIAVPLFLVLKFEHTKAKNATMQVHAMQNQLQALERQQQSYQALMREPQNAAVLMQSGYLNGLFRRKAFSWTATMTDLETVLPEGVQVLSLDPVITKSGEVQIHLRVSGSRNRAIQLVQNLEKSRHFASPRLAGETLAQSSGQNNVVQPMSNSSVVDFNILADYRPVTAEERSSEKNAGHATPRMTKASSRAADGERRTR